MRKKHCCNKFKELAEFENCRGNPGAYLGYNQDICKWECINEPWLSDETGCIGIVFDYCPFCGKKLESSGKEEKDNV